MKTKWEKYRNIVAELRRYSLRIEIVWYLDAKQLDFFYAYFLHACVTRTFIQWNWPLCDPTFVLRGTSYTEKKRMRKSKFIVIEVRFLQNTYRSGGFERGKMGEHVCLALFRATGASFPHSLNDRKLYCTPVTSIDTFQLGQPMSGLAS